MRDITLEDTFLFQFTTRAFATGIPGTLSNTPVLSVKESGNATPITAGVSVAVDVASVTGLNEGTVVATDANGYELGKSYAVYISTGTVDSVSVIGEVVHEFTIGLGAAAVDLANATDGLTALKVVIDAIPTTAMRGTDSVVLSGPTKAEMDTAHGLLATEAKQDTMTDILRGLVQVNGTIGATGNTTSKLHLDGLTYGNDEINGWTLIVFDDSTAEYHQCLVTDWVLSTELATVQVRDGAVLPFTPEASVDKYWLVTPATVNNTLDEIITGSNHNVANSFARRVRQLDEAFILAEGVIATVTDGRTITLDTGAIDTADFYIGQRLQIEEGTGSGQTRIIVAYSAARVALLDYPFTTNPDTASRYSVVAADVHVSVSDSDLAEGLVAVATSTTQITLDSGALANADYYNETLIIFTHGTGAGQATHITGYTAGRVATLSPALDTAVGTDTIYHIQAVVPILQIAKEVWDEAMVASTGAPAITASMRRFMEWWATLSRNEVHQTATQTTIRNDADDGDVSTSAVSDDGTTFIRQEFST